MARQPQPPPELEPVFCGEPAAPASVPPLPAFAPLPPVALALLAPVPAPPAPLAPEPAVPPLPVPPVPALPPVAKPPAPPAPPVLPPAPADGSNTSPYIERQGVPEPGFSDGFPKIDRASRLITV
jgi:hypothetical protein